MTNLTPELKAKFEAMINKNFIGDSNFTIKHVFDLMLQAYELDRLSNPRLVYMRRQANCVFGLTNGFTPEQRKVMGNMLTTMEEMAGYVLEFTNHLPLPNPPTKLV